MSLLPETTDPAAPPPLPQDDSASRQAEPDAAQPKATRRQMFTMGAALAASVLAPARSAAAQRIVRPRSRRPASPEAPGDSLERLVRRITNGVTREELTLARSLGFKRYLAYHLDPDAIDDSAVESFVTTNYPALTMGSQALSRQNAGVIQRQLYESVAYRAAFSKRQLHERMVHFWSDHFNIYYPKVRYLKIIDDRTVPRRHALGKFHDLLRASAHSPAMLEYLDNTRSRGQNTNQNYARELMELHTLGVDGGYDQTDVEEVTRCLTGWTIAGRGDFRFDPTGHDFTAKTVLGTAIPAMPPSAGAAGIQDGETVLDILLDHPSTARFISTKMIRWLLRYDPPEELVAEVAATYTRTGGDIPSMIRDILTPANLLAAPPKYKQPYQLVLSALRATRPSVTNMRAITAQLGNLGQPLFLWADPDGYPDSIDWWSGLVLQRWNFCGYITAVSRGNIVTDVSSLLQFGTAAGITQAIGRRMFGDVMPEELSEHVSGYLSAAPINEARVREAFALALSSTTFQWY